jgi:hypothetical protein
MASPERAEEVDEEGDRRKDTGEPKRGAQGVALAE